MLRIAAIPTSLTWAARLSNRFAGEHPNVRFTVLSRPSSEILSMLDAHGTDAAISYLDHEPLGRVSTVPLYLERYMLVCSTGSRFAGRRSVSWKELAGQRLCLLTPEMQNRRIVNANLASAGVAPEASSESNSLIVLVANVMSGGWVSVLPEDIAGFLCADKSLRTVPLSDTSTTHRIGLVVPLREPHTPITAALLAEARRLSSLTVQ